MITTVCHIQGAFIFRSLHLFLSVNISGGRIINLTNKQNKQLSDKSQLILSLSDFLIQYTFLNSDFINELLFIQAQVIGTQLGQV